MHRGVVVRMAWAVGVGDVVRVFAISTPIPWAARGRGSFAGTVRRPSAHGAGGSGSVEFPAGVGRGQGV